MKKRKSVRGDLVASLRPPRPFHAHISEPASRLASTSKHTPNSYSPCIPLQSEPSLSAGKSPQNSNLQLVLPRAGSPTGSLHDRSDEEMETAMRDVEVVGVDCDQRREGFRVRSCSSDRNLGPRVKSGRVLPPVSSNEALGKGRNRSSSGARRHRALTDDDNDLIPANPPVPRPPKSLFPRKSPLSEVNLQPSQHENHHSGLLPKVFRKRTLSPSSIPKENRLRVTRMLQGLP